MNSSEFKFQKAIDLIEQKGLDGLIIFSSGAFHFLNANQLQYFSDWRPMGPKNAAVISKTGDVALIVTPAWDLGRTVEQSWIQDVRVTADFSKELSRNLREFKMTGQVGLAGSSEMTSDIYHSIEQIADVVLCDDIVDKLGLPCTDPIAFGADPIIDRLLCQDG